MARGSGMEQTGDDDGRSIVWTAHARAALALRGLSEGSVRTILNAPAWIEPDPDRPGVTRAFGTAPETGVRWVRVAFRQGENGDTIVITVHPDRDAKPPEGA